MAGAGAAAFGGTLLGSRRGYAATEIAGVEWGGSYIEVMKQIEAQQSEVKINWELHGSGAAAILAKVKASWPEPRYDFIAAYDPVFIAMIKEDWVETVTPELVPNLAKVPEAYVFKDSAGNFKNIPRSVAGHYFGYRPDTCPIEFSSIDQLLDPKLKGQICWPHPLQMSGLPIVALAYHHGGDERNIEPGWKMLAEIAKSGNIGRVCETEVDFINSMTSGETSVSFWNMSAWMNIAKNVELRQLTKHDGMITFMATTGSVILKNRPNLKATANFLNLSINAENNSLYSKIVLEAPVNIDSTAAPNLQHMVFTKEENAKYVKMPDWAYLAEQVPTWVRRWEQEIAPLL
jgi:putative spermidine/putrescine transport system substrate-binding protein